MNRLNLLLVAAAALLAGCVTTGGPTMGQQLDGLTQSIQSRMGSMNKQADEPVTITFTGTRTYVAESGMTQEVFALMPDVAPGTPQYNEAVSVVAKLAAVLKGNPYLTGYIYVSPADARMPLVLGYNSAIEQIAGRGRITIKSDSRLNVSRAVLVWLTDPAGSAAMDALLSGEKRGLISKLKVVQVPQTMEVSK